MRGNFCPERYETDKKIFKDFNLSIMFLLRDVNVAPYDNHRQKELA